MDQDLGKPSCPTCPNLSPNSFTKVDDARPNRESPALVSEAVLRPVEWEALDILRLRGVADEASGSMSIEANEEEESKMMRVPKGLEALCADFVVGRGIHQHHDEQHEMTSDTASLGVVNIKSPLGTNLCEAD